MIRIGGATGYWGEADLALPQFLTEGDLDFIVFDYLAEITMSIMARAKAADPEKGYATDFVSATAGGGETSLRRVPGPVGARHRGELVYRPVITADWDGGRVMGERLRAAHY